MTNSLGVLHVDTGVNQKHTMISPGDKPARNRARDLGCTYIIFPLLLVLPPSTFLQPSPFLVFYALHSSLFLFISLRLIFTGPIPISHFSFSMLPIFETVVVSVYYMGVFGGLDLEFCAGGNRPLLSRANVGSWPNFFTSALTTTTQLTMTPRFG